MDPRRIAEIRKRYEAATPGTEGPKGNFGWYVIEGEYEVPCPIYRDGPEGVEQIGCMETPEDATFVAHTHTDIPVLVEEVERLKSTLRVVIDNLAHALFPDYGEDLWPCALAEFDLDAHRLSAALSSQDTVTPAGKPE